MYYCFGCGSGRKMYFTFIMEYEKIILFVEATQVFLAQRGRCGSFRKRKYSKRSERKEADTRSCAA